MKLATNSAPKDFNRDLAWFSLCLCVPVVNGLKVRNEN
jgi:hypothetical protein